MRIYYFRGREPKPTPTGEKWFDVFSMSGEHNGETTVYFPFMTLDECKKDAKEEEAVFQYLGGTTFPPNKDDGKQYVSRCPHCNANLN
jgi:hypothetical protein